MEENELIINDFNSHSTQEQTNSCLSKKKIIILVSSIIVALTLIIIFLIIINIKKSNKKESDDSEPGSPYIGEINCVYYIEYIDDAINILGNEFLKNSNFDLLIDGKKMNFTKQYKFNTIGEHKITFGLLEDISMDYMFKDLSLVAEIELISTNNNNKSVNILSMISTFENTEKLKKLKIEGFLTNKVKFMNKLFYKSGLNELPLDQFNVEYVIFICFK